MLETSREIADAEFILPIIKKALKKVRIDSREYYIVIREMERFDHRLKKLKALNPYDSDLVDQKYKNKVVHWEDLLAATIRRLYLAYRDKIDLRALDFPYGVFYENIYGDECYYFEFRGYGYTIDMKDHNDKRIQEEYSKIKFPEFISLEVKEEPVFTDEILGKIHHLIDFFNSLPPEPIPYDEPLEVCKYKDIFLKLADSLSKITTKGPEIDEKELNKHILSQKNKDI